MSGICGWFLAESKLDHQQTQINNITKTMLSPLTSNITTGSNQGFVYGVCHQQKNSPYIEKDRFILLLEGRPLNRENKQVVDAVWLAEQWQTAGEGVLKQISGQFALVVFDKQTKSLVLAVDQMGFCPLFYIELVGGGFAFASRATALQAFDLAKQEINPQAIYSYLYCHMVPSPTVIYQKQQRLLPAERLIWSEKGIQKQVYWQLNYGNEKNIELLEEELFEVLRPALKACFDQDKVAAFLSGGVDSSTVAGLYKELKSDAQTYSMGFNAKGYDETEFARETAQHFGTDHHEYYVTPEDVVDAIPKIAAFYDQPFGNASAIPAYACAKLAASEGINTMLGGDGGDELFGGNERYMKQGIFEIYGAIPKPFRTALLEPFAKIPKISAFMPFGKIQSYINQAKIPLPERLETYNFLNRRPLAEIFNAHFIESISPAEFNQNKQAYWDSANADSIVQKMLYFDLKYTLADNDLPKVSRMCELAGIQIQYPLLDLDVVEFSARLSADILIKDRQLRYFFKYAMRDFLPQSTLTKSKQGFGLPFGLWSKEHPQLKAILNDSLSDFAKRDWVNRDWIEWIRQQHQGEHASYYGVMLWVMMMLEQWLVAHQM